MSRLCAGDWDERGTRLRELGQTWPLIQTPDKGSHHIKALQLGSHAHVGPASSLHTWHIYESPPLHTWNMCPPHLKTHGAAVHSLTTDRLLGHPKIGMLLVSGSALALQPLHY